MTEHPLTETEVGMRLSAALDQQGSDPVGALQLLGALGLDLKALRPFDDIGWPTLYVAHVGLFSAQLLWSTKGNSDEVSALLDVSESVYEILGDRGGSANCADLRRRIAALGPGSMSRASGPSFCSSCGSRLVGGAQFCQQCGHRVAS